MIKHILAARKLSRKPIAEPIQVGNRFYKNPQMDKDSRDYTQHLSRVPRWLKWLCK